jgi:hypothetical protein
MIGSWPNDNDSPVSYFAKSRRVPDRRLRGVPDCVARCQPKYSSLGSGVPFKSLHDLTRAQSGILTLRLRDAPSTRLFLSLVAPHGPSVLANILIRFGKWHIRLLSSDSAVNKTFHDQQDLQYEDSRRYIHSGGSCYCIRKLSLRST